MHSSNVSMNLDSDSGQIKIVKKRKRDEVVTSLCSISPNTVAIGFRNGLIKIEYLHNFKTIGILKHDKHRTTVCSMICIGNFLISGSFDEKIKIWDLGFSNYPNIKTFSTHTNWVRCLCHIENNKIYKHDIVGNSSYFASGGDDGKLIIFDLTKKKIFRTHSNGKSPIRSVESLRRFRVAYGDSSAVVVIYDIINRNVLHRLESHVSTVRSLCFFQQNVLLSGGMDRKIIAWDIEKGKVIKEFVGHNSYVFQIRAMNHETFISCSTNMMIWNFKVGKLCKVEVDKECVKTLLLLRSSDFMTSDLYENLYIWDGKEFFYGFFRKNLKKKLYTCDYYDVIILQEE